MSLFRTTVVCTVLGSISLIALAAGESEADRLTLNRLQQIGQASLIYANENRGYLPTSFGQMAMASRASFMAWSAMPRRTSICERRARQAHAAG